MIRKSLTILSLIGLLSGGCTINDPNHNDKIRYSMARIHADRVLEQINDELSSRDDYDLVTFWRRHWDSETKVMHVYKLYDFVKTSDRPGPKRFVIAYDKVTRKTYLRSELRSNENLDSLPPK